MCPGSVGIVAADQVILDAAQDNTIYSESDDLSNGSGEYFFSGRPNSPDLRRGLISFDVAGSSIPTGSTITSVQLTLYMSRSKNSVDPVDLHLVLTDWGEGASNAPLEEGQGVAAQQDDATWRYTFYNAADPPTSPSWTSLGGDFSGTVSASIPVGAVDQFYTWGSTAQMVADVQSWLDSAGTNYGWLLLGDETSTRTAARFNSRTNPTTSTRPELTIDFTPPVVEGACCYDDGSCLVQSPTDCSTAGGSYEGDGTDCSPNPCPQPGACCRPDGTCTDVLEVDCDTQGGTFQGEGTNCATTDCDGACCLINGTCLETTLTDCGNQSGAYQGFATDCTPNPCAEPDGACCFNDGTCSVLTASGCGSQNGVYQGDGTDCTPNPCPQPGACCFEDGTCTEILESDCLAQSGSFEGEGASCTPNPCPQPGACCFDDGSCTEGFESDCDTAGGVYQGDNTTCTPNPCPQLGACCFDSGTCAELLEADCTAQSGTFQGEGTTCTADLCPVVLEPFVDPLPIPPVLQPTTGTAGGVATYDIDILEFSQQLHRDLSPTRCWGYEGTYPAATIEATVDMPITVNWINNLRDTGGTLRTDHLLPVDTCPHGADDQSPRTVVHLHGGHVPPEADGYPEHTFLPGFGATYVYPNSQLPATLWYHDHALGITRLNVYLGLAGFYLLRDQFEIDLGLPSGEFEIPLAIQDRTFNSDGSFKYPAVWQDHFFGDTILVNGKVWPFLNVKQGKYRFRLLSGSNSRTYTLTLVPAMPFVLIGGDGGLLPQPITVNELTLGPADRADVIVDFASLAPGTEIVLTNSAPAPFPGSPGVGVIPNVMKFVVQAQAGHTDAVPANLRPIETLLESDAIEFRDFTLRKNSDPCAGSIWQINDLGWDDITETPIRGTTEVWRFINQSGISHPMHMHLVMFQVLDRQNFVVVDDEIVPTGSPIPPAPHETGWKDTVMVHPQQFTRVIARFDDYTGLYAYHCHILEHEDHEMMRQFQVVACENNCGDINGSGGPVDLNDFASFATCFGQASVSSPGCLCSDLNTDGNINLEDFATFASLFGLGSTAVPPDCSP